MRGKNSIYEVTKKWMVRRVGSFLLHSPFSLLVFTAGIFLLVLNIAGFFIPLRNPDIYNEPGNSFTRDITLTEEEFYRIINFPVKSPEEYVYRLNGAVNRGIAHYWLDEGAGKYRLTVPPYENYILYLLCVLSPENPGKWQFTNYKKAVERGVGLCSQQSFIISEIFKKKGIDSRIVLLSKYHVIAMARIDPEKNIWWFVDPDYGVVIPRRAEDVLNNPEIIKPYYIKRGYDTRTVVGMVKIYREKDRLFFNDIIQLNPARYYIEYWSYILIWIIPVLLMMPQMVSTLFF